MRITDFFTFGRTNRETYFQPGIIYRSSGNSDAPPNAYKLSDEKIWGLQQTIATKNLNNSDVFTYYHGPALSGAYATGVGVFFTNHLRFAMKISRYGVGRMTSYVTIMALPFIFAAYNFDRYITRAESLGETCRNCLLARSMVNQIGSGFIQPCVLATVTSFAIAKRYRTMALPAVWDIEAQKKILKMLYSKIIKFQMPVVLFSVIAYSYLLTTKQSKGLAIVNNEILEKYNIKSFI